MDDILDELEAYAKAVKKAPGTICREATGNFRLFDRLRRRRDRMEQDAARLREYMAQNPPNTKVTQ